MKKIRIFVLAALTAVFLAGTVFAEVSSAADIVASGDTWEFRDDGTLVLSGYTEEWGDSYPWGMYSEQVRTLFIGKEVGWLPVETMFLTNDSVRLENIAVEDGSAAYLSDNGVLYRTLAKDSLELICYPCQREGTEYEVLPHASVNEYAFMNAKYLEKVTLPADCYYIGNDAFLNCTALTEVVVNSPTGVSCPEDAFEGCRSLDPAFIEQLCWNKPFTDIHPQSTYYEAVKFVEKNGIMNGTDNGTFSPDTGMTRGMFVTVLGRMAGITEFHNGGSPFRDVKEEWYSDAVYWADAKGIAKGYDDGLSRTFGVNDKITIEQAVVMLARYAGVTEAPMYDMQGDYDDTSEISDWAKEAMRWATAEGIYEGYGRELRPKANAPRALIAQMMYNFAEKYTVASASLGGFSHDASGEDEDNITLFVNGSPVECEGIYLNEDGVPMVPYNTVYNALGGYSRENHWVRADELASELGAEYHWFDTTDRKQPYLFLSGAHVTFDRYDSVGLVKSEEAAAKHLRETLITAYETRYGVEFVPSDTEVPSTDEQNWHRYKIAHLSADDIDFRIGRFYKFTYIWDFYVDMYTDDVFMMYNGITNQITKFDPTSPGAFTFAG